jgi:predicted DNA-binding transcriptional regulator AlpA
MEVKAETTKAVISPGLLVGFMEKAEFCRELGISERTADRWHEQRIGPPRTVLGRRVLYSRDSVLEWLRSRETSPYPRATPSRRRNRAHSAV